jgi:hypothetical protein
MSDNWDFYLTEVNDHPASVFLDMGIAPDVPIKDYTVLGVLRVIMNAPREDGLSSQEEFDDLVALEDHLIPATAAGGLAHHVGRDTSGGTRDYYFYTKDGDAFMAAVNTAMEKFPAYKFDAGIYGEADWNTYLNFLYPSDHEKQIMSNRGVLAALAENGDDHDIKRQIDHQAVFKDARAGQTFVTLIQIKNFQILQIAREKLWGGNQIIDFCREDKPAHIDDITIFLHDEIKKLGGHYDGWGCNVMKGEEE